MDKRKDSFVEEAGNPGEKVDSCPEESSWLPIRGQELLKEGFKGVQRGATCRTAPSALTVTLKLAVQWSGQCHLDCFKHS